MAEPSQNPFSRQVAAAAKALAQGQSRETILADMERQGISRAYGEYILKEATPIKREAVRAAGVDRMVAGIAMLLLGGAVTLGSYLLPTPGGLYIITIGLFVSGAIAIISGLVAAANR